MEETRSGPSRRRLSEQAWRVMFQRFDDEAMTIREFCEREGLSRSSFTHWRSRLGSSAVAVSSAASTRTRDGGEAPFVDLGLLRPAGTQAKPEPLELRIELGGGVSLHLVRR
jgi:hypothetical protein